MQLPSPLHGLATVCSLVLLMAAPVSAQAFSYEAYERVLDRFVDDQGWVDYEALQAEREDLDTFNRQLAELDPAEFEQWPEADRIALWINAYNSLTLELIIDHYPIQRRLTRLLWPVGIRHIPGAWTRITFPVMGRELTLDEIEHEILRVEHDYPEIHLSLVCAAAGCPPLRDEPYLGERLDEQHDEQAERFLAHPDKFRIDHEKRTVHLSSIFEWFGEDFIPRFGNEPAFDWGSETERAVMTYLAQHLSEEDREQLTRHEYRVRYVDYDWSLNDSANR